MTEKKAEKPRPSEDLVPLTEAVSDVTSGVVWGLQGTGKTEMVLKSWPMPIMVINLDRPLDVAKLKRIPKERHGDIYVKNMRENIQDLTELEALQIKQGIEDLITRNVEYFKGGTVLLDGGSTWRSVIKLADSKLGSKIAEGKRFNPKDKDQVNAYIATFLHHIVGLGLNLAVTAHAAWSWIMTQDPETNKNSLQRTNNVYPKLDDQCFEQTQFSLLLFKRCQCGRPITSQDGTCSGAKSLDKIPEHTGRNHIVRIVENKYKSSVEGQEFDEFDYPMLYSMCFGRKFDAAPSV